MTNNKNNREGGGAAKAHDIFVSKIRNSIVSERWVLRGFGFFWFVTLKDEELCLMFRCVKSEQQERSHPKMMTREELIRAGAVKDLKWKPVTVAEAMRTIPATPDRYLQYLD